MYLPIIYNSLFPFIKKTKDSPYFSLKLDWTIDVKLKYQIYIVILGIKMVARLKKICFFVRYHRNIQPVKIFIISQYFYERARTKKEELE